MVCSACKDGHLKRCLCLKCVGLRDEHNKRQGALEALDRAIDAADKHELGGVPAWLFNLRAEIEGGAK